MQRHGCRTRRSRTAPPSRRRSTSTGGCSSSPAASTTSSPATSSASSARARQIEHRLAKRPTRTGARGASTGSPARRAPGINSCSPRVSRARARTRCRSGRPRSSGGCPGGAEIVEVTAPRHRRMQFDDVTIARELLPHRPRRHVPARHPGHAARTGDLRPRAPRRSAASSVRATLDLALQDALRRDLVDVPRVWREWERLGGVAAARRSRRRRAARRLRPAGPQDRQHARAAAAAAAPRGRASRAASRSTVSSCSPTPLGRARLRVARGEGLLRVRSVQVARRPRQVHARHDAPARARRPRLVRRAGHRRRARLRRPARDPAPPPTPRPRRLIAPIADASQTHTSCGPQTHHGVSAGCRRGGRGGRGGRWPGRSGGRAAAEYGRPDASHSRGYIEIGVKPGIVLSSFTTNAPSARRKQSTRAIASHRHASNARTASARTSAVCAVGRAARARAARPCRLRTCRRSRRSRRPGHLAGHRRLGRIVAEHARPRSRGRRPPPRRGSTRRTRARARSRRRARRASRAFDTPTDEPMFDGFTKHGSRARPRPVARTRRRRGRRATRGTARAAARRPRTPASS